MIYIFNNLVAGFLLAALASLVCFHGMPWFLAVPTAVAVIISANLGNPSV